MGPTSALEDSGVEEEEIGGLHYVQSSQGGTRQGRRLVHILS